MENAIAERANGILKTEWLYRMTIPTRKVCKKELTRIIAFYNDERPHMSMVIKHHLLHILKRGHSRKCGKILGKILLIS